MSAFLPYGRQTIDDDDVAAVAYFYLDRPGGVFLRSADQIPEEDLTLLMAAASAVLGRKSRSNPLRNAATSGAGSIATSVAGPFAGRFVRNLIGGLMR